MTTYQAINVIPIYMLYIATNRSDNVGGNWSTKRRQFSSPTWVLKPCRICCKDSNYVSFFKWFHISILTFCIIWCKSCGGFTHEAIASQKNIKSGTTPAGLTVIIWHMPRNAESFSSLSLIWRKEVHLYQCKQKQLLKLKIEPD